MGFEILEDGEEALLYRYKGEVKHLKGPKRLWLAISKIRRLERHIAQPDEYLRIEMNNGTVEHMQGPCTAFLNPMVHKTITTHKSYCLDNNQAIVVYKNLKTKESSDDLFQKDVIYGPIVYVLKPGEWVHEFLWHGIDDNNKTRYIAGKNRFKILNFAPSQLYYNVDEVRTADDALIRVKLMIFYKLNDIQKLLNETKDPIGDILNACCADVIGFSATKTYIEFIEKCYKLNDMKEYPTLVERAKRIGYEITSVVFRGYFASPKLQQIHDNSIRARTELKLQYESELQKQETDCLNLDNEYQRVKSERALEKQKLTQENELKKKSAENQSKLEIERQIKTMEQATELKLKEFERTNEDNLAKIEHLKKLKEMRVDVNEYLQSTLAGPEKLIQIIFVMIKRNTSQFETLSNTSSSDSKPKIEVPKFKALLKVIHEENIRKSLRKPLLRHAQTFRYATKSNNNSFVQTYGDVMDTGYVSYGPAVVSAPTNELILQQMRNSYESSVEFSKLDPKSKKVLTYRNLVKTTQERFRKNLQDYMDKQKEKDKIKQVGFRFPLLHTTRDREELEEDIEDREFDKPIMNFFYETKYLASRQSRGANQSVSLPAITNSRPELSRRSHYLTITTHHSNDYYKKPVDVKNSWDDDSNMIRLPTIYRNTEFYDSLIQKPFTTDRSLKEDSLFWSKYKGTINRHQRDLTNRSVMRDRANTELSEYPPQEGEQQETQKENNESQENKTPQSKSSSSKTINEQNPIKIPLDNKSENSRDYGTADIDGTNYQFDILN